MAMALTSLRPPHLVVEEEEECRHHQGQLQLWPASAMPTTTPRPFPRPVRLEATPPSTLIAPRLSPIPLPDLTGRKEREFARRGTTVVSATWHHSLVVRYDFNNEIPPELECQKEKPLGSTTRKTWVLELCCWGLETIVLEDPLVLFLQHCAIILKKKLFKEICCFVFCTIFTVIFFI